MVAIVSRHAHTKKNGNDKKGNIDCIHKNKEKQTTTLSFLLLVSVKKIAHFGNLATDIAKNAWIYESRTLYTVNGSIRLSLLSICMQFIWLLLVVVFLLHTFFLHFLDNFTIDYETIQNVLATTFSQLNYHKKSKIPTKLLIEKNDTKTRVLLMTNT